ncbi:MAG: hypothetical protein HGB19_11985 [Chlorobiales bacterium]|nr:hypothetical protein [Chlorobiales bacterium]
MTGKIGKRNEKILRNVELENFDFLEIPELYIHSGELSKNEVSYLRARLDEMRRVRENCDTESQTRMKEANERAILHYLGEMRYRRLQLRMQMYLKEYCEKFIESYDRRLVKPERTSIRSLLLTLNGTFAELHKRFMQFFRPYR